MAENTINVQRELKATLEEVKKYIDEENEEQNARIDEALTKLNDLDTIDDETLEEIKNIIDSIDEDTISKIQENSEKLGNLTEAFGEIHDYAKQLFSQS
jgi:DNA-binding transcriptional MerR regulator